MSEIMNRGDVVDVVAAQVDLPQNKVDAVIKAFEAALVRQAATGGEVRLLGFGSFKVTHRAARTSRNPQTGDPVPVAARNAIRFVPGKTLKDAAASSLDGAKTDKKAAPKPKAKAADAATTAKTADKKDKKPAKAKKR